MNLDQTQALMEEEEDGEKTKRRRTMMMRETAVAALRVLAHGCFSETEFPLFAGETVVGRDPGCAVCVPVASLSRRHAAFEASPPPDSDGSGGGDVRDARDESPAFVRDLGSLNGTRRGRLTLRPHARYEIRDGDVISFGEVQAIFRTSQTVAASVSNKEPTGEAAGHDDDSAAVADDDVHPAAAAVAAGEDETDSDLDIFPDESDRTNGSGESIREAERVGREKEERGKIAEERETESKNSKIPQPATATTNELWAELGIESDVGKGEESGKDSSSAGVGNSYTGNSDTGKSDTGNVSAGIPKEGRGRGLVIEDSWLEEEEGGYRRQLPLEETQNYGGAVGGAALVLGGTPPVVPPPLGRSGGGDGGPRVIATGSTGSPSCLEPRRRRKRRGAGRTIVDEQLSPSDTVVPDSEEELDDSGPLIPAPRKCLRLDVSSSESETDSARDQTASQPILLGPQANLTRRSDQDLDVTPGHRHHQQQQQQQQQQELQSSGSETDIEDLEVEEEQSVKGEGGGRSCQADKGESVKLTAKLPQQAPEFHMDSDTDIEEDAGDGGDGGGGCSGGQGAQAIAGAAGAEDTDEDDDSEDDVHLLGGWIRQPGAGVAAGQEAELGAVLQQEPSPESLSDMPTQHFPCIDEVETQAYVYPRQSHWSALFPISSDSSTQPCGTDSPSHPPPSSASPPSTSSALPMASETSPSSSSSLDETQPMEQFAGNKRQATAAMSPATGACPFDDSEPTQPVEWLFGVGNDREISPGASGGGKVATASAEGCRASKGRLSKSRRFSAEVSVEVPPLGARGGRDVGGGAGREDAEEEVGGEVLVEAEDETLGPQGELSHALKEAGDVGKPSTEEAEGGGSLGGDSGGPANLRGDRDSAAAVLVEKRDRGKEESAAGDGLMNGEGGNSASTTENPEGVETVSSHDDETIDLDAELPAESEKRESELTGGDEPLRSDTGQSTGPSAESSEGGGESGVGGGVPGETTGKTLSLKTERSAEDPKHDGDGEKIATGNEDSLPSTAAECSSTAGEDRGRESASTEMDAAPLGPQSASAEASTETGDAGEKSTERQGVSLLPQTAVPPTPAGSGEEVPPAEKTAESLQPGSLSSSKRGGRPGEELSGEKEGPRECETAEGSATSGARQGLSAVVVEEETRRPEVERPGTSKRPGRKSARKWKDLETAAASGGAKGNSDVPSTAVGAETRHPDARRPETPSKLGRPSAKAKGDLFRSETSVAPVEGKGRDELTAGVEEAARAADLDRPETLKKVRKTSKGERESAAVAAAPVEARDGGDPLTEDGEGTRERRTECPESSKKLGRKRSAEDGYAAPPGEGECSGDAEEARLGGGAGGGDGDGGESSAEPSTPAGRNAPRRSARTPRAGLGGSKSATAKRAAPPPEPDTQPEPPRSRRQRNLTAVVKRLPKLRGSEHPEDLTKSRDDGEEGAHVDAAGTVEPLAETSNQRDVNPGHPSPSTRGIGQRRTAAGRSKVASSEDDATEQGGRVVEAVPISSSMDRKTRAKQKAVTATSATVAVESSGGAGSDVAKAPRDDGTGSDVAKAPRDDRTGSDVTRAPRDDRTGSDVTRTPRDDRTGSDVAKARGNVRRGRNPRSSAAAATGGDAAAARSDAVDMGSGGAGTGTDGGNAGSGVVARTGRGTSSKPSAGRAESAVVAGGSDVAARGSGVGDAVRSGSVAPETGSDAATATPPTSKVAQGRARRRVKGAATPQRRRRTTRAGGDDGSGDDGGEDGGEDETSAALARGEEVHFVIRPDDPRGQGVSGGHRGSAEVVEGQQRRQRGAGGGTRGKGRARAVVAEEAVEEAEEVVEEALEEAVDSGGGGADETKGVETTESGGDRETAPQEEAPRRRRVRPQQQQVVPQEVPPPLAASHNAAGQEEGSSDVAAVAATTAASDDGDGGDGAGGATIPPLTQPPPTQPPLTQPPLTLSTRKRRGATEQVTAPQKSRRNSRKPGTSAASGTSQTTDAPGTPHGRGGPSGNSGTPEIPQRTGTPQGRRASGNSGTPEIPQRTGTPQGRRASGNSGTPEIPQRTGTPQGRGASEFSGTPGTPGITGGRGTPRSARNPRGDVPKVAFTGVAELEALEQRVRTLGWAVSASARDCSHLVTDRVCRTVKMLCAVARGVPVVTPAWIQQCEQSGRVVDSDTFIVSDEEQEAKFDFRLRESLAAARERPLFHGCRVHVTAGVKPEPVHMRDIVECGGATWLPKMPRTAQAGVVVVSCAEDSARLRGCPGIDVVSAELILTGVLRQRLDVDAHRLNTSHGYKADSSDIDGGRDVDQRGRKRASMPATRGAHVSKRRR